MKVFTRHVLTLLGVPLLLFALTVPAVGAQTGGTVFTDPPKTFSLVQGWYEGRATHYYDFGGNSPPLNDAQQVAQAPIYVLVTGFDAQGQPQPVAGQHNIIDVVPGDAGYSDLWHVIFVTVPPGYQADMLRSVDAVRQAGYPQKVSEVLVNCPVVPLNSQLSEGTPGLTHGWYKGREVHYFDFGPSTDRTAPIYAFITGMDAQGQPQFVPGQHNVIPVIPGNAGYSPFWNVFLVQVPASYQANTITSVAQVMNSGYPILHPGLVVNCPVIRTDGAVSAPGMPRTGSADPAGWLALLTAGAMLLSVGLLLRRRVTATGRVRLDR
jgi:hypothetical protein